MLLAESARRYGVALLNLLWPPYCPRCQRRALHPRMPIDPTLIEYRLRLQGLLQRACMIDIISLLPGTLSATLEGDTLTVHVLNRHAGIENELSSLESVIAGIFGASLGDRES